MGYTNDDIKGQLPQWQVREVEAEQRLSRQFSFDNFKQALEFTNRVGELAEQNQHHPLIMTEWGKVTVEWWSHEAGGITADDLAMAGKTDLLAG